MTHDIMTAMINLPMRSIITIPTELACNCMNLVLNQWFKEQCCLIDLAPWV